MKPKEIKCPSCGAEKKIHNPGIVTVVCEYCDTAIYWNEEDVLSAGKQAVLPEGFSRLYRGASGRLKGKNFVVTGRIRYSFGQGFWDEWFLEFEDTSIGWLTEDNHDFSIQQQRHTGDIPAIEKIKPGTKILIGGTTFHIHEIGEARCIGMEGDLPIKIATGETYKYADGSSPDGKYSVGIEFDEDPPTIFIGRWLDYQDISLDDEGLDW